MLHEAGPLQVNLNSAAAIDILELESAYGDSTAASQVAINATLRPDGCVVGAPLKCPKQEKENFDVDNAVRALADIDEFYWTKRYRSSSNDSGASPTESQPSNRMPGTLTEFAVCRQRGEEKPLPWATFLVLHNILVDPVNFRYFIQHYPSLYEFYLTVFHILEDDTKIGVPDTMTSSRNYKYCD